MEAYGQGVKVIDEWWYFEDDDVHPRIMRYMGMSRTRRTVTLSINADD